jgi:tetratricopeptide (TPR) repeat protein
LTYFDIVTLVEQANALVLIQEALHQGELSRCEALLYQAFKNTPNPSPELIHLSALWHHSCGRNHQALQILRALLQQTQQLPHFIWNDLGSLYAQNQQPHLAEQCFMHALSQAPNILIYAFNYARSLHDQTLYSKAAGVYMELLRRAPEDKEYRAAAIETFAEMGERNQAQLLLSEFKNNSDIEYISAQCFILRHPNTPEKALDYLQQQVKAFDQGPEVKALIGFYARESNDYVLALQTYTELSKIQPTVIDWAILIGVCLIEQKEYTAAEQYLQPLVQEHPLHPEVLLHLGDVYNHLQKVSEAIKYWTSYISLVPHNPEVLYNLGNLFSSQKIYPESIQFFKQALVYRPAFLEAWINLTLAYYENREYAAAEKAAYEAIQISPENSRAHIGYGDALLMQQKYEEGFNEIEWRFAEKNYQMFEYPAPAWKGEDLQHKHILVMSEQGLGDIIMFSRFIFELQARYPEAKISFRCRPELTSLFTHWPFDLYVDRQSVFRRRPELASLSDHRPVDLYVDMQSVDNLDYAVALMSLLKLLKVIPNQLAKPTHLSKSYTLSGSLSEHIKTQKGPKIGLVWSSGEGLTQSKRSFAPDLFINLVEKHAHCHFYGLQKGVPAQENPLSALANYTDLASHLHDFTDTAACCQALDLVISVDTSVAHLAGALNTSVWILLPFSPDWRWGAKGTTSAWYPSAYLIRQNAANEWSSVIERVGEKLSHHFPPLAEILTFD